MLFGALEWLHKKAFNSRDPDAATAIHGWETKRIKRSVLSVSELVVN